MIDPITGLPDLSSDVYQIPLNTDSIPYDDLQAESRLPRQPLFPDDIIPTTALLTGLRSDNKGEVVHTDDNHAAKVYVVNFPAPSSGGATPVTPNKSHGLFSDYVSSAHSQEIVAPGSLVAGSKLCLLDCSVCAAPDDGPGPNQWGLMRVYLLGFTSHTEIDIFTIPLVFLTSGGAGSVLAGRAAAKWDYGWSYEAMGFAPGEAIQVMFDSTMLPLRVAMSYLYYEP